MEILKIENLNSFYDKSRIIRDLNLSVEGGETVAVLGPNGAGKTTLIKSICGLVKTEGKIFFKGEDITKLKPHERIKKGISISPEGRRLFPDLSVEDNLILGSQTEEYEEQMEYVFNVFPILRERRRQIAKTLSGGEQQMLAVGRALMSKPKLLLMDEPSLGLAPIIVRKMTETIRRIKNELNISILIVEQNIHMALEISDKAYVLMRGEIVREGTPETLKDLEKEYLEI